ncbi:MAG: hypothetical protein AAFO07_10955 [Bacteroidota bacterium]
MKHAIFILSIIFIVKFSVNAQTENIIITIEAIDSLTGVKIRDIDVRVYDGVKFVAPKVVPTKNGASFVSFETTKKEEQTLTIEVTKKGYLLKTIRFQIPYNPNDRVKKVYLIPNIIRGRVIDKKTKEGIDPDIKLFRKNDSLELFEKADSDGAFFFYQLFEPKQLLKLRFTKLGYEPREKTHVFNLNKNYLEIQLIKIKEDSIKKPTPSQDPKVIQGAIRDHKGLPASEALIAIKYGNRDTVVRADSDGQFAFKLIDISDADIIEVKIQYHKHKIYSATGQFTMLKARLEETFLEIDKKRRNKNLFLWKGGISSALGIGSFIWSEIELDKADDKVNENWETNLNNAETGRTGAVIFGAIGLGCLITGIIKHNNWKKDRKAHQIKVDPAIGLSPQSVRMGLTFKF